jgi:hypothetical protein
MTQPKFRPIEYEDEVRPSYHLAPPPRWRADRPADFRPGPVRSTKGSGVPGPDQGYALLLAERLVDRMVLTEGEYLDDVIIGGVVIALRRAALFGRAPVLGDIELALTIFGYLGEAPAELVSFRRSLFDGLADDYWGQRSIAHLLPEDLLRTPKGAPELDGAWRQLASAGQAT